MVFNFVGSNTENRKDGAKNDTDIFALIRWVKIILIFSYVKNNALKARTFIKRI